MIALSEQQIEQIENHLDEQGLTYEPLKEELLDHICCMIELSMWEEKQSFGEAYEQAIQVFEEENIFELQEKIIVYSISKPLSMSKLILMSAMLLIAMVFGANAIQQAQIYEPPSIRPVKVSKDALVSGYGMRVHPLTKVKKLHTGVDFKIPLGTPVYATADGVVEKVISNEGGYGKHIQIKHDEQFKTRYAHLSAFEVKEGEEVKKGDLIAYSGNTGKSIKPHLHYEVMMDGKHVNPEEYFEE